MSGPPSRLNNLLGHFSSTNAQPRPRPPHMASLSPTQFLPRAASIEPNAAAVMHITANGSLLRRCYQEFADRARGLAYYLRGNSYKRVGIVAPNTPAFLESVYGVVAAGGTLVPVNYRLKPEDIDYILDFAEVDSVIVDAEFLGLIELFRRGHPNVSIIVDSDTGETGAGSSGQYNEAILEGLRRDRREGSKGWDGLNVFPEDEDSTMAIPFTSGTTSRPKGCVYTHRGAYLAVLGNVVESGLNLSDGLGSTGRCKYLWTLPMFHAMGWMFPWAVVAVRGTNVCLRKIDYPVIWRLLKQEGVTHFNAAPTVNTLLCAAKEAEKLVRPVRVTMAASPPTPRLFEQMMELNLMPMHVYGMTETYGPIVKAYHLPAWDRLSKPELFARMARQGHGFLTSLPVRVVKLPDDESDARHSETLVDVAKDGQELGEVVFFGNICCKEYYKDAEATRKLFLAGGLHSGDLAVWHPDGSVHLKDRAKDIIISGGENISSVALEGMLAEHAAVLEVGVVAVPDSRWGERPKAYVTVKEGQSLAQGQDLIDWAKNQSAISSFMVPREVEVVDELPKTSTGKIQKNVLREWSKRGRKD